MTNCCVHYPDHFPHQQRGGATLLVALALTIALVALAIALGHTSALEQRMARNSLLAEQTRQAANAGLNYGLATLKAARPTWLTAPDGTELATPNSTPPLLTSHTGDSFALNITFMRDPRWRGYILARSSAAPASDPDVEAHVTQFVRPLGVLTAAGEDAPPLLVDGCVDLTQVNDIYPDAADGTAPGVALATSGAAACNRVGGANLHGGHIQADAFADGARWDHLFTLNREALHSLAQTQADDPTDQRDYWWARSSDLSGGDWRTSLGTATRPIVLIIPAELGCPAFSGGTQIVGLVFIEADCSGGPAWGDARIYGNLSLSGDIAQLGPTTRLLHISHAPGHPVRIEPPPLDVLRLAGSWRDF